MTGPSPWQPPDGSSPDGPPQGWTAPSYGPPQQPQYGPPQQPQYGPPQVPSQQPPYVPPPPMAPSGLYAAHPAVPLPPLPRKSRAGLWIGLGIGALVLICCVGGLFGFGGLIWAGMELDKQESVAALEEHLDAVKSEDFDLVYENLCAEAKAGLGRAEYADKAGAAPRLLSYRIGDISRADDGDAVGYDIEVDLTFDDGVRRTDTYFVFTEGLELDQLYVCPPTG